MIKFTVPLTCQPWLACLVELKCTGEHLFKGLRTLAGPRASTMASTLPAKSWQKKTITKSSSIDISENLQQTLLFPYSNFLKQKELTLYGHYVYGDFKINRANRRNLYFILVPTTMTSLVKVDFVDTSCRLAKCPAMDNEDS